MAKNCEAICHPCTSISGTVCNIDEVLGHQFVEKHKYDIISTFLIKPQGTSWLTYEAGKKGCTGEGESLLDDLRQILTLEDCKRWCDNTSRCNAISWNSRNNRCYLKSKQDACKYVPCDWGRNDAIDWNFYWKNCGKQIYYTN